MQEWINKKCKIFVRNLNDKPVIYTGTILSVEGNFVTISAKNFEKVTINMNDIIQIKEEEDNPSFYQP